MPSPVRVSVLLLMADRVKGTVKSASASPVTTAPAAADFVALAAASADPATSSADAEAEAKPVDSLRTEAPPVPVATPVRVAVPSAWVVTSAPTPSTSAEELASACSVSEEEALSTWVALAEASPVAVCCTVTVRLLLASACASELADSVASTSMFPWRTVAVSLAVLWALLVLMAFTVTFFSTDILTRAGGTVTRTVAQAWPATEKARGQKASCRSRPHWQWSLGSQSTHTACFSTAGSSD
mmetsp:Transcript_112912/g.269031  ORF Transcript_112912/g.269031 Transcript_112912/m.269031 type:complete len:242 (+) Transcript_112912:864-1589(+)